MLVGRGHCVLALRHGSHTLECNDGTTIPPPTYDGAADSAAGFVLEGDVTAKRLGLAPPASGVVAASLNLPKPTYDRMNVGGMPQALAFAAQSPQPVPLLHVSAAYVCGDAGGVVPEAPTTAARFDNG